jgi:hypothetical protein
VSVSNWRSSGVWLRSGGVLGITWSDAAESVADWLTLGESGEPFPGDVSLKKILVNVRSCGFHARISIRCVAEMTTKFVSHECERLVPQLPQASSWMTDGRPSILWFLLDALGRPLSLLVPTRLVLAESGEGASSGVEQLRVDPDCLRNRLVEGVLFILSDECGPD